MQKTTPPNRQIRRYRRFTFAENAISNSTKIWRLSFWKKMDSFALLSYAILTDSRILLQRLLSCQNFTLDSEDLFCWYKQKK